MSGLNSLLKYRFTRKTDKIHPDGDRGDNSSQDSCTPPNSDGRVTPEITVLSVIETPKSQQPSPSSESPLIQRANTNGCSQSPVSSQETQNTEELEVIELESSGPWLSKKKASLLNGYNDALLKRTKISKLSHGRRRLKSESSGSGDSDVETIDSSDSEDGADNKRKRSGDYGNGDSEVTGGQTKRRRVQLLSDSSEENGLPSQDQSLELSSQETIPNSQILEEQVNSMREMFPAATTEKIKSVLVEKNYNTDEAAQVLLAEVEELERSTSEKSKSSRHGRIVRTAGDDDDDDDAQPQGDDDDSDQEENSSERGPVLSFFESACLEELMSMPSCSRKKAEVIMGMRPFASWEDLVTKFQSTKTISYSLISRCWEIIQIREVVLRLMQRCEKISEKLGTMVASLAGQVTVNEFEDQIKTQPKILNPDLQMKPYQLVGLNWLRLMHSQELNGILADEMGLGKTVQAISFLSYLLELGDTGPHIIIVPSSTVENWLRELTRWCPDLQVVLYYGSQEERKRLRKEILYDGNDDYNIILTTYNMTSGSVDDRALFKTLEFHYAVFDEGHMLKNMTSQRYQHLQKIRAHRRLLLTGTPLQNNLLELMSLLCFVMPDMFVGKTESLKRMFTMITKSEDGRGEYEKERIANAKNIMKPFVLRRLKKDVLKQMPQKEEHVEHCPMITDQQVQYDKLVDVFSKKLTEEVEGLSAIADSGGGAGILMQLRKLANHPLLMRYIFTDEKLKDMSKAIAKEPSHRDRGALPHIIQEDMAVMSDYELHTLCKAYKNYLGDYMLDSSHIEDSGKFRFLDSFLGKKKQTGDRVLLFSQFTMMLDIIEAWMKLKGYKYLRLDGQTPVVERQQMIDEFNQNTDIFIFLLSTRAGGLGINLTAANVVVLHDIDFNPYNDKQAEDRCHRMGQTRVVEVVKLISQGTVEEGMLSCAKYKLNLEKDVTGAGAEDEENPRDVLSLLKNALGQHGKHSDGNTVVDGGTV